MAKYKVIVFNRAEYKNTVTIHVRKKGAFIYWWHGSFAFNTTELGEEARKVDKTKLKKAVVQYLEVLKEDELLLEFELEV